MECFELLPRARVGWHELLPSASTSVPPPTTIALHPRDAPPAQVMAEEMRPRDKWSAFTLSIHVHEITKPN